jgi:hypothetical protein
MGSIGTLWRNLTNILLALFDRGVAVRVGDLGDLAQGTGDVAVDEAEDGDCAEGDGDDGAGRALVRYGVR